MPNIPGAILMRTLAIPLVLAFAPFVGRAQEPKLPVPASKFLVYDILWFTNKPDVSSLGMASASGTGVFFAPGANKDSVDEKTTRRTMHAAKDFTGLYYIDIENWPVCFVPDSVAENTITKFERVIAIAREEAPRLRFGLYGVLPTASYWTVVPNDTTKMREWNRCNARLQVLADRVDAIFPSLYTFYDDEHGWEVYARAMLAAARKYGKPVYPFLWPEYHESNPKLGGQAIPAEYWARQLNLCRQAADGIVLWSGLKRPWDGAAPWWQETKKFLEQLQVDRRAKAAP